MVVDTHAHVYSNNYDSIEEIINSARNNGIKKIINCGESLETSKEIISLSKIYNDILVSSIGIHPEYAELVTEEDILELEKMIKDTNVIAVGEIGLDYHYEINKDKQIYLFKKELDLAEKYKLPVIIHSRDATEDTLKILKNYKIKGVVHCFTGSFETASEYIKMGFALGIGGVVTFKNSKLIEVVKKLDLNNVIFETDSPFLTPEPFRKFKNEPSYVTQTIKYVAEKLGIEYDELAYITNKNVMRIFDITI